MKEINFIFGKAMVVFNAVGKEASRTFPLRNWLKMFCSPYSQISASLIIIDSITFITIDPIYTTFGKFVCFIFVVGKNFAYVVGIDASSSDIVFFKNTQTNISFTNLKLHLFTYIFTILVATSSFKVSSKCFFPSQALYSLLSDALYLLCS